MARRVSLNDPDLAIRIIEEDGGVILTDFTTTTLVEQVNADAAPYINAIVKEVIDLSASIDLYPFAQSCNKTSTNIAKSVSHAASHAKQRAARCYSDAVKPRARSGSSNPAYSKSSIIFCERFLLPTISATTSRYRPMQFSPQQQPWTLGLEYSCKGCIATISFGSRLIIGTAPEVQSTFWVRTWVWVFMFLVWILRRKMELRLYVPHFHDIYDGFCSCSLVRSRLSSLGSLATSPALRGMSHFDERGRGICSPRLDSARRWSEHYFSEQALARVLLLPLLHATRGNIWTS